MNLDNCIIADIETIGFLEDINSSEDLHVFGYAKRDLKGDGKFKIKTTKDYEDIKSLLEDPNNIIVGHYFYLYDIPVLEKMFPDLEVKAFVVDTLFLSWYLDFHMSEVGLEVYGEKYGIPKPEIKDWKNLSYEDYCHRVEEDCKINTHLWLDFLSRLRKMYKTDDKVESFLRFLMTKASVYKMHQDNPLTLDVDQCYKNKELFEARIEERKEKLKKVMPKVIKTGVREKPDTFYKKGITKKRPKVYIKGDGSLSANGEKYNALCKKMGVDPETTDEIYIPSQELKADAIKWLDFLQEKGLPESHSEPVEYVVSEEEPNPTSVPQIKDWLFGMGWKPEIFVEAISKVTGEKKQVPQIKKKDKSLCNSVLKLAEEQPVVKELTDLSLLTHRLGYFKGFIKNKNQDGTIVAGIAGLTNTLRIRHRNLVNLIKPSATYGEYVRSLLLSPKGQVMIGSDLSSLENVTRNNFIYPLDPDYVNEMSGKYFDSHLDIGVTAGLVSKSESLFYRWWKEKRKNPDIKPEDIGEVPENFKFILDSYKTDDEKQQFHDKLDKIRSNAKTVSYSALYGVGKKKLAKELKCSIEMADKLLTAYWERNWSVKKFSSQCVTKTFNDVLWVKNPLNGYWYSLRSDKDIFSTVNQSAGDYIFTLWEHFCMKMGLTIRGGFHDEIIITCKPEQEKESVKILYKAIDKVNKVLDLELPVGIDYKVGFNYSEVH